MIDKRFVSILYSQKHVIQQSIESAQESEIKRHPLN